MQSHGPKRIYTPKSLEFWFEKLEEDWEGGFSSSQLEKGREIYVAGDVRELELTDHDAIVHRRVEKRDEYAVIEWTAQGMEVRSSSTDIEVARALAVAGLHEIEELVADEISPLPGDPARLAPPPPRAAPAPVFAARTPLRPGLAAAAAAARHGGTGLAASQPPVAPAAPAPGRTLTLVFRTKTSGLTFEAMWLEADGKTRTPALGPEVAAHHLHVSTSERAKLIGLAAYARKAHFHYHQETGAYLLESLAEIPNFLRTVLPAWRKLFAVDLDERSANLLKGTRTVEIEAVAEKTPANSTRFGTGGTGLNLRWIFRAGERMLTDSEVKALVRRGGQPVIVPSIGIVSISPEKWESYRAWQDNVRETRPGDAGEDEPLSPYLVFSLFNDARLRLTLSPEIEAWRKQVLGPPPVPPELPAILRPYQRRGVEWLHHLCDVGCHGLLADEMGLGKTLQVLSLLAVRQVKDRPSVIVCPASVVPVWREEIARFFPHLRVDTLKTGHDFAHHREPVIWIASYTQLRKHRALLPDVAFAYAILDEGQFIKNPTSQVAAAARALAARHRLVLTGTPIENRLGDLWSLFAFAQPGLLGSQSSFRRQFNERDPSALGRLHRRVRHFLLRRTKAQAAPDLPPRTENEIVVDLEPEQRRLYDAELKRARAQLLGVETDRALDRVRFNILASLLRLRQICCHPALVDAAHAGLPSAKLDALIERLEELREEGHQVLVFSQFVGMLELIRERLEQAGIGHLMLTGATEDRQQLVEQFQTDNSRTVFLLSLKAAGFGLNLTAASYAVLYDPWWNPAVEAQAIDRTHRIGQTKPVFAYRLLAAGTIEQKIRVLQQEKAALAAAVVQEESLASVLDLESLRRILA